MNLTLHLVAKDVRHLRRALILWVGLLVGQVVVSYRLVSNGDKTFGWFERMGILNFLLLCLGLVVTYLLAGMLVLEDPVAGEKMFWVTRPIKGSRLLLGKVITALLIFVALPIFVRVPWWLLCDFSFGNMINAAIRIAGVQLLFTISAFAVASLSANIGRFLLMSVLLAMGLFSSVFNLIPPAPVSYALENTRQLVALTLFGVTGLIGTIMMYRTRRAWRVTLVLGIGFSLAYLAGKIFPVELSNPLSRYTQIGPLENSSPIAASLSSVRLDIPRNKIGSQDNSLTIDVQVMNLPEPFGVNSGKADVTLQWLDGTTVRSSARLISSAQNDNFPLFPAFGLTGKGFRGHWDAETAAKWARSADEILERATSKGMPMQRRDLSIDGERRVHLFGSFPVSNEIAEKILKSPPSYRMMLKVEAGVPEVLGEIAIEPGSVVTRHGRIELLSFTPKLRSGTKDNQSRLFTGVFSVLQESKQPGEVIFCYLDRQHQEVGRMLSIDQTQPTNTIAERITWGTFPFEIPRLWRTDHWIEVPDWQKNLRIGLVTFKPAGTFERALNGEQLVIDAH